MAVSEELGVEREIALSSGTVRYRERGEGAVVVFVHGLLVNADLWRRVVPELAASGARCIAPDWPLGSHGIAMPEADLSPRGIAALIGEFLDRLDLQDVTLVANDTGGALVQLLMATAPARVARVVLTPSDCFEYFFPVRFAYLRVLAPLPGALWLGARAGAWPLARRLPFAFGGVTKHGVPTEVLRSWLASARHDRGVRADVRRFLHRVDRRDTLAAAEALRGFDRPVLLAWAIEDRVFPISLAHRLAEILPQAHLVAIPDAHTFVPEDQPGRLVDEIRRFLRGQGVLAESSASVEAAGT